MTLEGPTKLEKKPPTISETLPIEETRGQLLRTKEDIKKIVEGPLVTACEQLYEKNIQTLSTTANTKDVELGYGGIVLNYSTLSSENKEIAKRVGELNIDDDIETVYIKIPISSDSTTEDISHEAERICAEFKMRPATWLQPYVFTFEQMKKTMELATKSTRL